MIHTSNWSGSYSCINLHGSSRLMNGFSYRCIMNAIGYCDCILDVDTFNPLYGYIISFCIRYSVFVPIHSCFYILVFHSKFIIMFSYTLFIYTFWDTVHWYRYQIIDLLLNLNSNISWKKCLSILVVVQNTYSIYFHF